MPKTRSQLRHIICHGTKFDVPDRHKFWNGLYDSSLVRFYLVGRTNKSWITKNREQSAAFGKAILRLVNGGGKVKILSDPDDNIVRATENFIAQFLIVELHKLSEEQRNQVIPRLQQNFVYAKSDSSHYRAIVSDNRLILIPSLNSHRFRDEALVLEFSKRKTPFEFEIFMNDVDRIFDEESSHVEIDWHSSPEKKKL